MNLYRIAYGNHVNHYYCVLYTLQFNVECFINFYKDYNFQILKLYQQQEGKKSLCGYIFNVNVTQRQLKHFFCFVARFCVISCMRCLKAKVASQLYIKLQKKNETMARRRKMEMGVNKFLRLFGPWKLFLDEFFEN